MNLLGRSAVEINCSEIFNMARCEGVVLVVEDHPLVRMGVLEVIIEAGFELLRRAAQLGDSNP